jgi:hypothetical protein
VDKRNFRKWVASLGLVEPAEGRSTGRHRPAQLYRFVLDADPERGFLWATRTRGRNGVKERAEE